MFSKAEIDEIIIAILAMWQPLNKNKTTKEEFKKKLQEMDTLQLISIFMNYKKKYKNLKIQRTPNMIVSPTIYYKITEYLKKAKKKEEINNPILFEILNTKLSNDNNSPFFDYSILASLNEEEQETLLAVVLYLKLKKLSQELTAEEPEKIKNIREDITILTTKINHYFPYRTDFKRYISESQILERWEQKNLEECTEDLKKHYSHLGNHSLLIKINTNGS